MWVAAVIVVIVRLPCTKLRYSYYKHLYIYVIICSVWFILNMKTISIIHNRKRIVFFLFFRNSVTLKYATSLWMPQIASNLFNMYHYYLFLGVLNSSFSLSLSLSFTHPIFIFSVIYLCMKFKFVWFSFILGRTKWHFKPIWIRRKLRLRFSIDAPKTT